MPSEVTNGVNAASSSKKRKRSDDANGKPKQVKKSSPPTASSGTETSARSTSTPVTKVVSQESILALEEAIIESPKNYNDIVTLISFFKESPEKPELAVTAAVSLCRTFCRLISKGSLSKLKGQAEAEATIAGWLKDRYKEYFAELCACLNHEDAGIQNTALLLLLRLVKEEAEHLKPAGDDYYFPHDSFAKITKSLIYSENLDEDVRTEFAEKLEEYDDLSYSFFVATTNIAEDAASSSKISSHGTNNILSILLSLKNLPNAETESLDTFYAITLPSKSKKKLPTIAQLSAHRKAVQECWLAVLRLPDLSEDHLKQILLAMTQRIVPSFVKPQLLMDFLTSSYDAGGSLSLLALNGLYHLISIKNLDYPNFFVKLYAIFTRDLFHVRYRSRFFRLLGTFLSSTHLPAALVASFIKKMSRLSLSAPPSAIVTVVPFVYNLLKKHPSCTYMIHRVGNAEDRERWRKEGLDDPFDEDEPDPLQTGAIDSSLWELEMLQSHWHPNVATLCRIIGEQFTKDSYNMEDFLDHSYASIFDAETTKTFKKPPVVEYNIPKRIFFPVETETPKVEVVAPEKRPLIDLWSF